jgi:osmotically-inducible protein OsmY
MPFREQVLMQRLGINDAGVARREIMRNDVAHNGTVQKMFGIDWMDASLYAIVLNTARVPVEDCIEQVARLAQSPAFQETAQSRSTLMDELILSRVRFALDQGLRSRATLGNIAATVSGGKVALTGATSEKRLMGEAVRLAEGVEGVMAVESQIAQIVQGRSAM